MHDRIDILIWKDELGDTIYEEDEEGGDDSNYLPDQMEFVEHQEPQETEEEQVLQLFDLSNSFLLLNFNPYFLLKKTRLERDKVLARDGGQQYPSV